jgi:hypothetical protein
MQLLKSPWPQHTEGAGLGADDELLQLLAGGDTAGQETSTQSVVRPQPVKRVRTNSWKGAQQPAKVSVFLSDSCLGPPKALAAGGAGGSCFHGIGLQLHFDADMRLQQRSCLYCIAFLFL